MTWNPKVGKYRSWYFSDWGEYGEGWWTLKGEDWHFKGTGCDAHGNKSKLEGSWKFTDDDTIEWEWAEKGPHGTMELTGKSTRKK